MTEPQDSRRDLILMSAADQALDLVVYDRKEDEDLPRGSVEEAVTAGEVTVEEIVEAFRVKLLEVLGEDT